MSQNENEKEWFEGIPVSGRKPALWGFFFLIFVLGTFGVWATTAPIDSAVIAEGTLVAAGKNKIVQHLEGGIIEDIHVQEGDKVTKGQVLLTLDSTRAATNAQRYVSRRLQLMALQYRLRWETSVLLHPSNIKKRKKFTIDDFPMPVQREWKENKVAAGYMAEQRKELIAGMQHRENEIQRLTKQINGQLKSIEQKKKILAAKTKEAEAIQRTLVGFERLWTKRLVRKSDLERLRGQLASVEAEQGEIEEKIQLAEEKVAELNKGIDSVSLKAREERIRELRQTDSEYEDVHEQAIAALDVSERVEIVSPVDGIIVQMEPNTKGGVLSPGAKIMEILPTDSELRVRAKVKPQDIDNIHAGLVVKTQMSGLNQRLVPMISGYVEKVSADLIKGDRPEDSAFIATIRLVKEDYKDLKAFKALPGMPVTVFIKTGEQTFMDYLLKPLRDSFRKALREGGGDGA